MVLFCCLLCVDCGCLVWGCFGLVYVGCFYLCCVIVVCDFVGYVYLFGYVCGLLGWFAGCLVVGL